MDVLAHPLASDELRSLWLFYSSPHPRDSQNSAITMDDLAKLLQSIREQDVMRSDIPPIEPEYVNLIMTEYLKHDWLLLWPEFSTNFNSFWTRRADIYENWRARNAPGLPQPLSASNIAINSKIPAYPLLPVRPPLPNSALGGGMGLSNDEGAAVRVLEAELVEISERLRQARYQLEEEKQKRHSLRDELDDSKSKIQDERNRYLETSKQLVILEEDKLTHEIQVSRLRESLEQNISLKETLQLDLDRVRMQLYHAKEKYETALKSALADNEAFRRRIELLEVEVSQKQDVASRRDMHEMETQNNVLRQVIEKYRRALPNARFADTADMASTVAFDSPKLASDTEFLNALMEALDKAKFLNKQMQNAVDEGTWSKQSWQDLCMGWRETVCELCDLFAAAHRLANKDAPTTKNLIASKGIPPRTQ